VFEVVGRKFSTVVLEYQIGKRKDPLPLTGFATVANGSFEERKNVAFLEG
jgi:hypothetical protein